MDCGTVEGSNLISILEKHCWFRLTVLITLLVLVWKMDGSVLEKLSFKILGWLCLVKWIGVLTLSLLQKLHPRKLEPWFTLWSFFLLRLLCISIILPYVCTWNTVVTSGLVLLVVTWNLICSCYLEFDMQDCCSFNCCFIWTLGSFSKCSLLKSFLLVLLW